MIAPVVCDRVGLACWSGKMRRVGGDRHELMFDNHHIMQIDR